MAIRSIWIINEAQQSLLVNKFDYPVKKYMNFVFKLQSHPKYIIYIYAHIYLLENLK